jgi:hypothetical protein
MNKRIEEALDNNQELQLLIMSPEWAHYTRASLTGRAFHMCITLGASAVEAREYLKIGMVPVGSA